MTKSTMVVTMMTTFLMAGAGLARAQGSSSESKAFLGIEFGAQPQQRTIEASSSFPLYDETATFKSTQTIHNGPVLGGNAGYRVRPQFGVAVGVSMFQAREGGSKVEASIPDPAFYSKPKTVEQTVAGLKHSELGLHFQAVWFHAVGQKLEVVLAAGPSLIHVKQDLTTSVTVPPGTQNMTVAQETVSKNALGFNAGFEGNYLFSPKLGLGLFVRYAGGTVDLLPTLTGVKVGGIQTGLGLRLRF